MAQRVYASPAEYFDFVGQDAPAGNPPKDLLAGLARASREVDGHIRGAVYDSDSDGFPTDPAVLQALQDATCAYVAYWDGTGDITGAEAIAGPVKIGSVSLGGTATGGASSRSAADTRVSNEAITILRTAGLLSTAVAHT